MTKFITWLATGVAATAIAMTAQAQQADAPAADPAAAHGADFRTFEPTEAEQARFLSADTLTQQGGEAVYNAVCAGCHMPQGEGAVGAGMYPALANNELLAGADYPIYLVVNGQNAMPPLGDVLDDQQVADVVNYIRSHFGNDYIAEYGEATAEVVAGVRQ